MDNDNCSCLTRRVALGPCQALGSFHLRQESGDRAAGSQHRHCVRCEARAARLTRGMWQGGAAAWWTRSGHVVVQPLINGRAVGYMILDTGAPGPHPVGYLTCGKCKLSGT